jgi:N-acetylglutamate synthase-like GNAT family acetyltransferase
MVNIRKADIKDSKEILNLLVKTPELQGSEEVDSLYTEEYVIDTINDKDMNLVLIAEENNKVIGMIMAEIWLKKKYSFLTNFVVDLDYRKKGIGKQIYNEYENICKELELKNIVALIHKTNVIMQKFCKSKGYNKGHEMYYYDKEL